MPLDDVHSKEIDMLRNRWSLELASLVLLACGGLTRADEPAFKRTRDVIYGRRDGMALTLDVFQPLGKANGAAIVMVISGNFESSPRFIRPEFAAALLERGYTVFAVLHGSQPRSTLLEMREDVNRGVRFARANAKLYGIDPDRIGIGGASSGGLLALLVAVAPRPADPKAQDAVDQVDSRVQAAACFFPGTDYLNYGARGKELIDLKDYRIDHRAAHDFRVWSPEERLLKPVTDRDERRKILRELSPISHISKQSPPTLLIHGEKDEVVPLQQSESFIDRLKEFGVPAKLVVKKGEGHGWATILADTVTMADWFDAHLAAKEGKGD
jgi:dipeptidyl aminopeptidase/acylaminoacyl peptidase